ncbi:MAG: succinate dehydrogenase, cytochrome b556 subunit [Pseudomonadota bacterium]
MSKKRPVNLNLLTIRFPIAAISSILHRASGLLLFLALPLVLWGLERSFTTEGFAWLQQANACIVVKLIEWFLLSGLIYHVVAGIRHLLMDAGHFETKQSGPISAWTVIIISALLIIATGAWLLL